MLRFNIARFMIFSTDKPLKGAFFPQINHYAVGINKKTPQN
jgi:hypothetical protein